MAIFIAAKRGNTKEVKKLLVQFPREINKTDYRSRTALHLAIELGHLDVAAMLIGRDDIDLAAKDCGGFTPLHLAAELGYDKIVALLLEKNPKLVAIRGHNDLIPLHLAVIGGHAAVVKRLLAMNVEMIEEGKQKPVLQLAVEHGHEEITAILVESVKSKSESFGQEMLDCALSKGYDRIATQLLAENPRLIDDADNCYGFTTLQLAARYGRDTIVAQLLVEQPHLIETVHRTKWSALHVAAENGHEKIVSQLLAVKPALANQTNWNGHIPLHVAAENGHEKVVAVLLAHDPELIAVKDRNRRTALHMAVGGGHYKLAMSLLARGAEANSDILWAVLKAERGMEEDSYLLVQSLIALRPEMMWSVDHSGDTAIHSLFQSRSWPSSFEEWMRAAFQTNSEAFCRTNATLFGHALRSGNKFAKELVEGKLSLDEIRAAFSKCRSVFPEPVYFHKLTECLLGGSFAMSTDVAGMVCEYLDLNKQQNPNTAMRGQRGGPFPRFANAYRL